MAACLTSESCPSVRRVATSSSRTREDVVSIAGLLAPGETGQDEMGDDCMPQEQLTFEGMEAIDAEDEARLYA